MAKEQRFERVYTQGALQITEIWVDKETGVNDLFHASGNAGGLTPLLDRDGKPVVSPLMRYFIPASERQGSCYFEFQPGRWRGRCWLPGSILLADERWEALRLTELFGGVLPEFDYFGVTPVSRGQWERIAARSRDEADWRAVIDEAAPWAEASFARHGVISILGL